MESESGGISDQRSRNRENCVDSYSGTSLFLFSIKHFLKVNIEIWQNAVSWNGDSQVNELESHVNE